MTAYSAEWFWTEHGEIALALQAVQIEFWLRELGWVELIEVYSSDPPSFRVRLVEGLDVILKPGALLSNGQICWYEVDNRTQENRARKIPVIAVNFSRVALCGESNLVTLTGFSIEAVFLKLTLWLHENNE